MQHVYLRQTRKADLDYILAADRGEDNRPFIIPWTREHHLQAMADRTCAHLIAEANTKVGYVILAGLLDPNRSVEFRRIVTRVTATDELSSHWSSSWHLIFTRPIACGWTLRSRMLALSGFTNKVGLLSKELFANACARQRLRLVGYNVRAAAKARKLRAGIFKYAELSAA